MEDRTFGGLTADELQEVEDFHGHMCPGLALGVHAARFALNEIGRHAADEEVVAVTETDMCGVDAVQYLTGCTFGKGNLIHQDFGKNAFTFMGVPPPRARIHQTIVCDECREGAMATRITEHDGRRLCRPCFERATSGSDDPVPARKGPNLLND